MAKTKLAANGAPRKRGRPKGAKDGPYVERRSRSAPRLDDRNAECRRLLRHRLGREFTAEDKATLLLAVLGEPPTAKTPKPTHRQWRDGVAFWSAFMGGSLDDKPMTAQDLAAVSFLCEQARSNGRGAADAIEQERSNLQKQMTKWRALRTKVDELGPLGMVPSELVEGARRNLRLMDRAGLTQEDPARHIHEAMRVSLMMWLTSKVPTPV